MFKSILASGLLVLATTSLMAVSYEKTKENKEDTSFKAPASLKKIPLAKGFYSQLPKDTAPAKLQKWNELVLEDRDFQRANDFIYNKKYQIVKENQYDAEFPGAPSTIAMPNYPKAIASLAESVRKTGNPIAAYEGSMIINTYLGLKFKNAKTMQKMFTEALYRERTCEGFLNKGKSLMYGTLEKKNLTKAKQVLEEGIKRCKGVSFYEMAISSKMLSANMKMSREKRELEKKRK